MIYLKSFTLPNHLQERDIYSGISRINNTNYPLGLFSNKELNNITFDTITCFYGGNGSGKTTLLNIIANKLNAQRKSFVDKGNIFEIYVRTCKCEMSFESPLEIKVISSDDVFDYLLDIRSINTNVNRRKMELSKEYLDKKYNPNNTPFENYEELRKEKDARSKSMTKYVRERLNNNTMLEYSNGESSLMFWEQEIKENAIYILDEPENSLSAENQLKLKQFIEDSARYYNCQFIISTHSPFLLGLQDAKIYDLDIIPVCERKFNELSNIKLYYDFFKQRENLFKNFE